MLDSRVYPPAPEDDGIVRETTHQAVLQSNSGSIAATSPNSEQWRNTSTTLPFAPQPAAVPVSPPPSSSPPSNPPSSAPLTNQAMNDINQEFNDDLDDDYSGYFAGVSKPLPELTVIEWQAPSRPFKARSRQFFSTILIIGLLISLILFFAGQVLPIAVVVAIIFLVYVLSVVPPGMVKQSITTSGIRIENNLYYWEEMGTYWFTEKYGQKLLHVQIARFPTRLVLLLGEITEAEITRILSEVLIQQRPIPTFYEKATEWLQEKIPLEN